MSKDRYGSESLGQRKVAIVCGEVAVMGRWGCNLTIYF